MSENEISTCTNISADEQFRTVSTTSSLGVLSSCSPTTSVDTNNNEHIRWSSVDIPKDGNRLHVTVLDDIQRDEIDTDRMTVLSMSPKQKNCHGDTNHHVCEKMSVNPFFNFMRLYRQLPANQGKACARLSVEGGRLWRAMAIDEKQPFRDIALRESRRRRKQKKNWSEDNGRGVQKVTMKHHCVVYTVTQIV